METQDGDVGMRVVRWGASIVDMQGRCGVRRGERKNAGADGLDLCDRLHHQVLSLSRTHRHSALVAETFSFHQPSRLVREPRVQALCRQ